MVSGEEEAALVLPRRGRRARHRPESVRHRPPGVRGRGRGLLRALLARVLRLRAAAGVVRGGRRGRRLPLRPAGHHRPQVPVPALLLRAGDRGLLRDHARVRGGEWGDPHAAAPGRLRALGRCRAQGVRPPGAPRGRPLPAARRGLLGEAGVRDGQDVHRRRAPGAEGERRPHEAAGREGLQVPRGPLRARPRGEVLGAAPGPPRRRPLRRARERDRQDRHRRRHPGVLRGEQRRLPEDRAVRGPQAHCPGRLPRQAVPGDGAAAQQPEPSPAQGEGRALVGRRRRRHQRGPLGGTAAEAVRWAAARQPPVQDLHPGPGQEVHQGRPGLLLLGPGVPGEGRRLPPQEGEARGHRGVRERRVAEDRNGSKPGRVPGQGARHRLPPEHHRAARREGRRRRRVWRRRRPRQGRRQGQAGSDPHRCGAGHHLLALRRQGSWRPRVLCGQRQAVLAGRGGRGPGPPASRGTSC
mmetsp:Transcript_32972/g.94229  ORF Transcript_32972/g.94229 Transcript_32972/m.94229 type:complete len:468 (+) Transcript_32972:680-2083(+)